MLAPLALANADPYLALELLVAVGVMLSMIHHGRVVGPVRWLGHLYKASTAQLKLHDRCC